MIQTVALAFLAATAIGGIAWVFVYPMLSGEKKAEARRANVSRVEAVGASTERMSQGCTPLPGRGNAQGNRRETPQGLEAVD